MHKYRVVYELCMYVHSLNSTRVYTYIMYAFVFYNSMVYIIVRFQNQGSMELLTQRPWAVVPSLCLGTTKGLRV